MQPVVVYDTNRFVLQYTVKSESLSITIEILLFNNMAL